jgi:ATP-dependent DNA helicase RecQ
MTGTGIYRANLRLEVIPVRDEAAKREHLARLLREIDGTGIVYTSTVRECETVTAYLESLEMPVARFHGKLSVRERTKAQERFLAGTVKAIVATGAFGTGIDKPDIRFVIHYNMPGSLESYSQEAGHAGRDGEPARCILLYQAEDRNTQLLLLNSRYPRPEQLGAVYRALGRHKADQQPAPIADIQRRADVALAKVRVVLAAMKEMAIIEEPEPGEIRLLRAGLTPEELAELSQRYEQQAEADRERLKRMVLYAQTARCRWRILADSFGEEMEGPCGHCDNCARPFHEPELAPETLPRRANRLEILPLPPLVSGPDPAGVKAGDILNLTIYGRGEVKSAQGPLLLLELADGEMREFRR